MAMDIRHIRHVRRGNTTYTTIAAAKAALNRSDDALQLDLTSPERGESADATNLTGFFRLTAANRSFLYYMGTTVVEYVELIFGTA